MGKKLIQWKKQWKNINNGKKIVEKIWEKYIDRGEKVEKMGNGKKIQ